VRLLTLAPDDRRLAAALLVLARADEWAPWEYRSGGQGWRIPATRGSQRYYTTADCCNCPAAQFAGDGVCKHALAVRLRQAGLAVRPDARRGPPAGNRMASGSRDGPEARHDR
jgi:hypothetical protein